MEHKYYYVGNRLQYETIGDSSALWYFYDADGNPSGIRYKDHSGTVNDYYFVCNWRGDVIQIYNASGVLVATYDYDAWGKVSENSTDKDTQNIAEINPIRYRGYYYDSETGLYYLKSRYYDPAVKRFLNVDGLVSTSIEDAAKNMFAYCLNNPVIYADPEGDSFVDLHRAMWKICWWGINTIKNIVSNSKKQNTSSYYDYAKMEEKAFTALETVGLYFSDQLFEKLLPELAKSELGRQIFFEGSRYLSNSMGAVSALFLGFQVIWDFDEYGGNTKDYVLAVGIDVGCSLAAVGAMSLLPSAAPVAVVTIAAIGIGYVSTRLSDEIKKKYIN